MAQQHWNPAVVEDLIFRQFLKGEDVANQMPAVVEDKKLPEFDNSVKSLFKYVESGGPNPVTKQQQQQQQMMQNQQQQQGGGNRYGTTSPTPLRQQNQQQNRNNNRQNSTAMSATPGAVSSSKNQQQQQSKNGKTPRENSSNMPAPNPVSGAGAGIGVGGGGVGAGATGQLNLDQMKRRRVDWPSNIPSDNQLKGQARSQLQPLTEKRIAAQSEVDPDLIFRQDTSEFPLNAIFAKYPSALKLISSTRGLSGDWRNDTFTAEEEADYKVQMGYTVLGSSQAQPTAQPMRLF